MKENEPGTNGGKQWDLRSEQKTGKKWPERLEQKEMTRVSWKLQEGWTVSQFAVSLGPCTQ